MDHPIRHTDQIDLRRRVVQLFAKSYYVQRSSNIVFVCGGNNNDHMRVQFRQFCEENVDDFDIFFPEYAMENYFKEMSEEPFNIAQFEEIVGDLSHAIVLFPEAPGSFAETGYFSKIKGLYQKTILVLDAPRQKSDSFISLGPAKLINEGSNFHPNVQIDYQAPEFNQILDRIRRYEISSTKRTLQMKEFAGMSNFQKLAIIQKIVDILSIATIEDIVFMLRGLFASRLSIALARKLISILVGAQFIVPVGDFGHYYGNSSKKQLLTLKDGFVTTEMGLRLELATVYESEEIDFVKLIEGTRDAH